MAQKRGATQSKPRITVQCRRCGTSQSPLNVRCKSCGAFTRLRHVFLSLPALGLYVATVGVLVTAYPLYAPILFGRQPDLSASLAAADLVEMSVLVTNDGSSAGTYFGTDIFVRSPRMETSAYMRPKAGSAGVAVAPGSSLLVELEPMSVAGWQFPKDYMRCQLVHHFLDTEGRPANQDDEISCASLSEYTFIWAILANGNRRSASTD
jgi:hypothetical protein